MNPGPPTSAVIECGAGGDDHGHVTDERPAYAIGCLRDVEFTPDVARYMREIDATLAPFAGRFIVHGGGLDALEGEWDCDVVVIEFPSRTAALQWYESADYQRILPLRTTHSTSVVAIVEGVGEGHSAAAKADALLAAARGQSGSS
jgi:uncharacterized protein (DUF1330 family)